MTWAVVIVATVLLQVSLTPGQIAPGTSSLSLLVVVAASWVLARITRPENAGLGAAAQPAKRTATPATTAARSAIGNELPVSATLILIGLGALPYVWNDLTRWLFGGGDPQEVLLIFGLRNLMWGLAAVRRGMLYSRLACLSSLFLAIFAFLLHLTPATAVVVCIYTLMALWWLLGAYWQRLQTWLPSQSHRQMPRSAVAGLCVLGLITALLGALLIRSEAASQALAGWFPSSGGTGDYDPLARSGINDGDQSVAGQQDASSFGPVRSDIFLESEMPSLYDSYNESAGDPIKKNKRTESAIPLGPQNVSMEHKHLRVHQQLGREFSAERQAAKRGVDKNTKQTPVLFGLIGRVPLHVRLETFNHWDGASLSHRGEAASEPLSLLVFGDRNWVAARGTSPQMFKHAEFHQVRIVNLKTDRVPAPAGMRAVNIDGLHGPHLFGWTDDGLLRMDREFIPQLSILQLGSQFIAEADLPRVHFKSWSDEQSAAASRIAHTPTQQSKPGGINASGGLPNFDGDAPVLPPLDSKPAIQQLAARWTANCPAGWPQIAAICERLRTEYDLTSQSAGSTPAAWGVNRSLDSVAAGDTDDAVERFLFLTQRGPDYLFAASSALLLRELGFRTRVASGFYAKSENYDHLTQQTSVYAEDLHFWVEVETASGEWLTVDPSPGYEVLYARVTWSEWAQQMLLKGWAGVCERRVSLLMGFALLALLWWFRVTLLIGVAWLLWRISPRRDPRRIALSTLKLLQRQEHWAGRPRQISMPVGAWLRQWDWLNPPACIAEYRALCQWALYGGGHPAPITSREASELVARVVAYCHPLRLPRGRSLATTPSPSLDP